MEKAERNEPTDPIDRAEPTLPMDKIDPLDPIESMEFSEASDRRDDEGDFTGAKARSGSKDLAVVGISTCRWSLPDSLIEKRQLSWADRGGLILLPKR
jgi:hypothetical protein